MGEKETISIHCLPVYQVYPKDTKVKNENNWTVVNYKAYDYKPYKFTAVGNNLPSRKDIDCLLNGYWKNDSKYGKTFAVESYEIILPTNEKGIVSYLSALRVGIGKEKAKRIYKKFGENVWDILETQPQQLMQVSGISKDILAKLEKKMEETKLEKELTKLLSGVVEISPRKVKALKEHFGDKLLWTIKNEPYMLCDVSGFSFKSIDKLGQRQGVPKDSFDRLEACVKYTLESALMRGHSCLPKDELYSKALYELNFGVDERQFNWLVLLAIENARDKEIITQSKSMFFLNRKYKEECTVAEVLCRLSKETRNEGKEKKIEKFIKEFEERENIILAEKQKEAIYMATQNGVSIITGGAGTGKTTIIKAILYVYENLIDNLYPRLLAPTGRASRRMSEATGYEAKTIHSCIQYMGEEECFGEMLDGDLFIVDESSMIDLFIASALLERIPRGATVIFVGDPEQLQSVGAGKFLADIISSEIIKTTKLEAIYRQKDGGSIVENSGKIREGITTLECSDNFKIFEEENASEVFIRACKLYLQCVKKFGLDNVVLLNPYREKTMLSVNEFNKVIRENLNPLKEGSLTMKKDAKTTFRTGDKVMQMVNTEIALNGDIGYIRNIKDIPDENQETCTNRVAMVEFNDDGKLHEYTEEMLNELDLAYCTTVHKSQGSEYETVIFVVSKTHELMLRRNLVYTGITRAKKNVAIVTEKKGSVIEKAIENNKTDERYSLLSRRMKYLAEN